MKIHRRIPWLWVLCVAVALVPAWALSPRSTDAVGPTNPETIQPEQQAQRAHLVILHVNDTHGRLGPHKVKGQSVGGVARLAGLIKKIRCKNPGQVLLLHAGDAFSRGDRVTNRYKGKANVDLMNRMGYDAMVLGNGEYYGGLENLRRRMSEAKFAILAGNIFEVKTETEKPKAVGKDFVVQKVGPLRVGLLGLSLIRPEDPSSQKLRAGDELPLAKKWLGELKGKADLVVLLSHQGLHRDMMLGGILSGVDIIVGGHTHSILKKPVIVKKGKGDAQKKVYLVQAGEYYEYLGRIDLDFEREDDGGWELTKVRSQLIRVNDDVEEDAGIAKRLKEYRGQLRQAVRAAKEQVKPSAVGISP